MRFILGNGKQLKEKLQDFPSPWVNWLLAAKILVIGVIDENVVGAFGVRGALNMTTAYVREKYRGQGIGRQLFEKAIRVARERGIHFLTGEAFSENNKALHLCLESGSKVVKRVEERKTILLLWPLTSQGDFTYKLLRTIGSIVPGELLARITDWRRARAHAAYQHGRRGKCMHA